MKHVASVLIVCIVSGVFWSSDVSAGQQAHEIQVADSAPPESAGAAVAEEDSTDPKETSIVAGGGQPAGQWAREMGVLVMSQAELDTSRLVEGWYAHVVYAAEDVAGTATGEIIGKDAEGIVVRSELWDKRNIVFATIESLAVAPDRRTLERWLRAIQAAQRVIEMRREDLDPSKLEAGMYVYVVYTSEGKEDAATGAITSLEADGLEIQSAPPVRRRGLARRRSLRIAFDDIEVIVAAENRGDVEAWPKARLASGLEARKRPWCEIGANLLSVSILKGQSDDTVTLVNGGGGMARITPTFYMSSFFAERISFDFGIAFTYQATAGSRNATLRVAQGGFGLYTKGLDSGSSYCRILATTLDGDIIASRFGAGISLGTRHVFRNALVLRYEVQYVRWLGEEYEQTNQVELLLNVGAVLGGR